MQAKVQFPILAALALSLLIATNHFALAQSGKCEANPDWSALEKRAWKDICAGKVANLSDADAKSRLTNKFMKDILVNDQWRKQIPVEGVRITGAIFERLEIGNINIEHALELKNCAFLGGAKFFYVRADRLFDLTESKFRKAKDASGEDQVGELNLSGSSINSSLLLRDVEADVIWLTNTRVAEHIYLDRANVKSVFGRQVQIGSDLVLLDPTIDELVMNDAKIDGTVKVDGSKAKDTSGLRVLDFRQTQIGGNLSLWSIDIETTTLTGASIKRDFQIRGGTLEQLAANNTTVGGDFEISGGTLGQIKADSISVAGAFRLIHTKASPVNWNAGAKLDLTNSNITNLQLHEDSWPAPIYMAGTTYRDFKILRNTTAGDGFDSVPMNADNVLKWLERSDSPQPYLRLAQVLKDAGYESEANKVHIAERELARKKAAWGAWFWESFKYFVIGYGYDLRGVWLLVVVFLLLGWFVVGRSPIARRKKFGIAYSFDLLLPVVKLRELHYDTELEPRIRTYFYLHRLVGFILASFLVAALSGLTKVD